jgi:hypothetical protein
MFTEWLNIFMVVYRFMVYIPTALKKKMGSENQPVSYITGNWENQTMRTGRNESKGSTQFSIGCSFFERGKITKRTYKCKDILIRWGNKAQLIIFSIRKNLARLAGKVFPFISKSLRRLR